MLSSFRTRSKDLVFAVSANESMRPHLEAVKRALKQIFDKGLEDHDRISLITYAKNARVVFSLVDKDKNYIQLRNQIGNSFLVHILQIESRL